MKAKIILVTLLLASLTANLLIYNERKTSLTKKSGTEEINIARSKADFRLKHANIAANLGGYKGISSELDDLISDANDELKTKSEKVDRLSTSLFSSKEIIGILKDEELKLKGLERKYLLQIDTLLSDNLRLNIQQGSLEKQIDRLHNELESLHLKVNTGELLIVDNVEVVPKRRTMRDTYSTTNIGNLVDRFEIRLDINENQLTPKQPVNVVIRVNSPSGNLVGSKTSKSGKIKHPVTKKEITYSSLQTFDYDNVKQGLIIIWEMDDLLEKGIYTMEIFINDNMYGVETFALR